MMDLIVLSVPANLKYLLPVENFVEMIVKQFYVKDDDLMAQRFRVIANEAFVNVLHHTPEPENGMVSIHFELDSSTLTMRFPDRGEGFKIKDYYPPYPEKFVGTDHLILKTLDGELHGIIENSRTLKLWFKPVEHEIRKNKIVKALKPGGMGLSIIVKFMDEVRFIKDEEKGHYFELKKVFKEQL